MTDLKTSGTIVSSVMRQLPICECEDFARTLELCKHIL